MLFVSTIQSVTGDGANLREIVDSLVSMLKSEAALLLEAPGGVDTNGQVLAVVLPAGEVLDVLEVSDAPCEEVGAHDRGPLEGDNVKARLRRLLDLLLGHVAECNLVLRDLNLKVKGRLEVRLVEARECPASIARLKLSAEHVVVFIILGDGSSRSNGGLVL